MIAQMSKREKAMATVVGVVLAVVLNFFLVKFFVGKLREFNLQQTVAGSGIDFLKKQETERALWSERDAWLNNNMGVVGDPQVASRQLSEAIRDSARKHTVTLEVPNAGVPGKQAAYTSLPLRIEAKAEWKSMFEFISDLQAPGNFHVFEQLELRVDPADKTKLRASMTLAKWFSNTAP